MPYRRWALAVTGEITKVAAGQTVAIDLALPEEKVAAFEKLRTDRQAIDDSRLRQVNQSALLGDLVSCPYCFGHWVAFALTAVYKPRLFEVWWPLDYFLTALVIAWLAAFQAALLCLIMEKAKM